VKAWIKANSAAQNLGYIAYFYGYTPKQIRELTPFQLQFLLAWLEWFTERVKP